MAHVGILPLLWLVGGVVEMGNGLTCSPIAGLGGWRRLCLRYDPRVHHNCCVQRLRDRKSKFVPAKGKKESGFDEKIPNTTLMATLGNLCPLALASHLGLNHARLKNCLCTRLRLSQSRVRIVPI
eukprot:6307714-Amphidinium_carterae.1